MVTGVQLVLAGWMDVTYARESAHTHTYIVGGGRSFWEDIDAKIRLVDATRHLSGLF